MDSEKFVLSNDLEESPHKPHKMEECVKERFYYHLRSVMLQKTRHAGGQCNHHIASMQSSICVIKSLLGEKATSSSEVVVGRYNHHVASMESLVTRVGGGSGGVGRS